MDKLVTKIRAEEPSVLALVKLVSSETLHSLATDLTRYHKPAPELPLPNPNQARPPAQQREHDKPLKCQNCGGLLTKAEANYCRANSSGFAHQLLCRQCQGYVPKRERISAGIPPSHPTPTEAPACCAECGAEVDNKVVVAFCRFNSRRFAGRILCRKCLNSAPK